MSRRTLLLVLLFLIGVFSTEPVYAQSDTEQFYSAEDFDAVCPGPNTDISCAIKTWVSCMGTFNPIPCEIIGGPARDHEDRRESADDGSLIGDVIHRPWATRMRDILWESSIGFLYGGSSFQGVTVREVGPERFRYDGKLAPDHLIGTHEAIFNHSDHGVDFYTDSVFFRRNEQGHWHFVSQSSWEHNFKDPPRAFKESSSALPNDDRCAIDDPDTSKRVECVNFVRVYPPES